MNISNKKSICRLLALCGLITVMRIPVSALCENPQNRPSFSSYEQAVKWYLDHGDLEWMHPQSSAIHKAAYDKDDEVMIIYFTSNINKGYIFKDVPIRVWEEFKNAPSKGRYYNSSIHNKYGYKLEK